MNYNEVIAVNDQDEVLDYLDKQEVHEKGILHRAISVFIINSDGKWLLQQRAHHKYHSGSLWTNATCTHPMKGESNLDAANRRLHEEMGLEASLTKLFRFQYEARLDNNLIENELDHIFIGMTDDVPDFNRDEVQDYRYIGVRELEKEMSEHPERFTEWFKLLFAPVKKHLAL
jgi:isopentenyl-diphosphate delta-isomerase